MKRSRSIKKYIESSSESEPEKTVKRKSPSNEFSNISKHNESSSESDIENYLLKPEKLDLDSNFFNTNLSEFQKIEENIFSDVMRLSDTDSEKEDLLEGEIHIPKSNIPLTLKSNSGTSSKMNFKQLQDYTKKIEEAKKQIEIYKAKKHAEENKTNILNLLAAGEGKLDVGQSLRPTDLHFSDFESCDSEQDDWEEIKMKTSQENQEKNIVPQGSLQITVDLPDTLKKKKGVDLLAAMKRRLNRIRKENQVLVHKVHLLCWIAHGNYINSSINDTETLARALSLLPSEQCYPSDRVDLSYLEQIVNWYKRTVKNIDKPVPEGVFLSKFIQSQISRKEAYNKKMLACIFIAILRALGIQCRLIMSLQVEPLRPPVSALHTISTKCKIKEENTQKNCIKLKNSSKTHIAKKSESQTVSKNNEKPANKKGLRKNNSSNNYTDFKAMSPENISAKLETNNQKPICSQNTHIKDDEILKIIKHNKFSNIKGSSELVRSNITLNEDSDKRKTRKNTKGIESNNIKLSVNTKIRKDANLFSDNDKAKPKSKNNLKELKTHYVHVKSTKPRNVGQSNSSRESKKERTSKIKNNLINEETLESKTTIPELDSTDNQKSSASAKSNIRSKSMGNASQSRVLRANPKKNVPQVDGIYDSDIDEILILQLDGANDNKERPKSNVSSNFKVQKKSNNLKKGKGKTKSSIQNKSIKLNDPVNETDSESEFEPTSWTSRNKMNLGTTVNLKKLRSGTQLSSKKQIDIRNDIKNIIKGRIHQQKQLDQNRLSKKRNKDPDSDSDSDYAPEPIKKKHHDSDDDFVPKTKIKRRIQIPGKSVLSESENEVEKNKKQGNDIWVEVFLEAEEKWISVDVIYGQVHCVKEIYQRATHPVTYVVAWDNNNNLKDISQRYCQNFNTVTRKQRVDSKWWNDSLKPFMGTLTARDREENDDLARQQLDQPLPKAISEYKNHPLYALRRHLLKFEGLYPPEPPTLGFIRGEAVYPRSCVHILHSRDIWLKQAKVVKLGEQPYKIVKARPKYDRLSNKVITDQMLEIFGPWQVQDYEPPTAENGIVPKNAFGNVDLFKPCMLPKECVHLKLPGLNKIARKMNIDIASAIVGFDFHGGWSHPVYDGFVVCKEYEDQLICAWEMEQDELEKKEEEKINKRVYGNWKKLIKGLLIRERLKAKYDFGEPSTSKSKEKRNKAKPTK